MSELTHGETISPLSGKNITVTTLVNIKGRIFKPNEQYCFEDIVTTLVGCGCGGKPKQEVKNYRVKLDNIFYDIPQQFAVETTVPITCEDQDFRARIQFIGNRTIDGKYIQNYNPYRLNPDPLEIAKAANNIPM